MIYIDPTGGVNIPGYGGFGGGGGGGGCDPFDPFCDPCLLDPFLCFPGLFPIGGGGGGGFVGNSPEQPRPFPWLLLPLGFFEAGSVYFKTVRCRCELLIPSSQRYGCAYACICPGEILIAAKPPHKNRECDSWPCPAEAIVTHVSGLGLDWGTIIYGSPPGFCE